MPAEVAEKTDDTAGDGTTPAALDQGQRPGPSGGPSPRREPPVRLDPHQVAFVRFEMLHRTTSPVEDVVVHGAYQKWYDLGRSMPHNARALAEEVTDVWLTGEVAGLRGGARGSGGRGPQDVGAGVAGPVSGDVRSPVPDPAPARGARRSDVSGAAPPRSDVGTPAPVPSIPPGAGLDGGSSRSAVRTPLWPPSPAVAAVYAESVRHVEGLSDERQHELLPQAARIIRASHRPPYPFNGLEYAVAAELDRNGPAAAQRLAAEHARASQGDGPHGLPGGGPSKRRKNEDAEDAGSTTGGQGSQPAKKQRTAAGPTALDEIVEVAQRDSRPIGPMQGRMTPRYRLSAPTDFARGPRQTLRHVDHRVLLATDAVRAHTEEVESMLVNGRVVVSANDARPMTRLQAEVAALREHHPDADVLRRVLSLEPREGVGGERAARARQARLKLDEAFRGDRDNAAARALREEGGVHFVPSTASTPQERARLRDLLLSDEHRGATIFLTDPRGARMHAELRLLESLRHAGVRPDEVEGSPLVIGGTKRPCVTCAAALQWHADSGFALDFNPRPGAFFQESARNIVERLPHVLQHPADHEGNGGNYVAQYVERAMQNGLHRSVPRGGGSDGAGLQGTGRYDSVSDSSLDSHSDASDSSRDSDSDASDSSRDSDGDPGPASLRPVHDLAAPLDEAAGAAPGARRATWGSVRAGERTDGTPVWDAQPPPAAKEGGATTKRFTDERAAHAYLEELRTRQRHGDFDRVSGSGGEPAAARGLGSGDKTRLARAVREGRPLPDLFGQMAELERSGVAASRLVDFATGLKATLGRKAIARQYQQYLTERDRAARGLPTVQRRPRHPMSDRQRADLDVAARSGYGVGLLRAVKKVVDGGTALATVYDHLEDRLTISSVSFGKDFNRFESTGAGPRTKPRGLTDEERRQVGALGGDRDALVRELVGLRALGVRMKDLEQHANERFGIAPRTLRRRMAEVEPPAEGAVSRAPVETEPSTSDPTSDGIPEISGLHLSDQDVDASHAGPEDADSYLSDVSDARTDAPWEVIRDDGAGGTAASAPRPAGPDALSGVQRGWLAENDRREVPVPGDGLCFFRAVLGSDHGDDALAAMSPEQLRDHMARAVDEEVARGAGPLHDRLLQDLLEPAVVLGDRPGDMIRADEWNTDVGDLYPLMAAALFGADVTVRYATNAEGVFTNPAATWSVVLLRTLAGGGHYYGTVRR